MNIAIVAVLCIVFSALGFCAGCFACLQKINNLEVEKATLTEWLRTSRKTNEILVKECNELFADLESAVNNKGIITGEDMTIKEKEPKVD